MSSHNKCFVISKMYVGSYLSENDSRNIGHEVTNLHRSDDEGDKKGSNYIYIYRGEHSLPSCKDDIEAVILTKQYRKGCQEIIGIATVDDVLLLPFHDKSWSGIKYGGCAIEDIFSENYSSQGEKETAHKIAYVKTKTFYRPKKRILLADKNSEYENDEENDAFFIKKLPNFSFSHSSLKNFVEAGTAAFDAIKQIAQSSDLLQAKIPDKIDLNKMKAEAHSVSYLAAMDKLYSENIFSNLLCYFLNTDRKLLKHFCKDLFGINTNTKTAKISREYPLQKTKKSNSSENAGRIDILIEDGETVIGIENKIGSGLNGKNGDQLERYKASMDKAFRKYNRHYFLFVPNEGCNPQIHARTKNGAVDGFIVKTYKDIKHSLSKYPTIILADEDEQINQKINLYYEDFCLALGLHGGERELSAEKQMEHLLLKRLEALQKKK